MEPKVLTTAELQRAGYTRRDIWAMIDAHKAEKLNHGLYLLGGNTADLTPQDAHTLRLRALSSRQAGHAVISHVSAALWTGLSTWGASLSLVHLTRLHPAVEGHGRRYPGVHMHSTRTVLTDHEVVDGLPVTTVARTVVDLARCNGFDAGVVAADSALAQARATRADLDECCRRLAGCTGIARARAVVAFASPRAESPGESLSRIMLSRGDFPIVEQAVIVDAGGRFCGRTDFLIDGVVAGEFDGLGKYGTDNRTTRQIIADEKWREAAIGEAGFPVVRWSWEHLKNPEALHRRIAAARARAYSLDRTGTWRPADQSELRALRPSRGIHGPAPALPHRDSLIIRPSA